MQIEDLSLTLQPKLKSWTVLVLEKLEKKRTYVSWADELSYVSKLQANERPFLRKDCGWFMKTDTWGFPLTSTCTHSQKHKPQKVHVELERWLNS